MFIDSKVKKRIKKGGLILSSLVIVAIIFMYILNINRFAGLTGDDFLYHFVYTGEWPKGEPRLYHNLLDWLEAIHTHMTQWNARFTSIVFEIAAMQLPKSVFNLINSVAFILVGIEANILASGKKVFYRPLQLISTYVLMWFFLAGFGSTVLWVSGATNYLWPTVIILGFFIPYRFNYQAKGHYRLITWLVLFLGILVGMANEVGSSTAIIVVGLFTYFNRPTHNFENIWWKITGLVANIVAFMVMITKSSGSTEVQNYGEKDGLLYHVSQILSDTLSYSGLLLLINLILVCVVIFRQRKFLKKLFTKDLLTEAEQTTLSGMIFLISGFAGIGAMIISPILFPRLWFAVNMLWIVSVLNLFESYQLIHQKAWVTQTVLFVATFIMIYLALPSYYLHLNNIKQSYDVFYTHEQLVKKAHQNKQKVVRVPGMPINADLYNPYTGTPYIMPGNPKKSWSNTWMAYYWSVDKIILDNEIPVQHSPQKDLPLVAMIGKNYQHLSKKQPTFKVPGITVPDRSVVKNKRKVANRRSEKINFDNSNLPKNKPWLRNAWIRYVDVDTKQVVSVERITSPYDTPYNISHASTVGYRTLANNPKSYTVNRGWHQTIDLKVKAQLKHLNVYFNKVSQDGNKKKNVLLKTEHFVAVPGQNITFKAPMGYHFMNGKQQRQLTVNAKTGEIFYEVKQMSLKQKLKTYPGLQIIGWGFIFWVVINGFILLTKRHQK